MASIRRYETLDDARRSLKKLVASFDATVSSMFCTTASVDALSKDFKKLSELRSYDDAVTHLITALSVDMSDLGDKRNRTLKNAASLKNLIRAEYDSAQTDLNNKCSKIVGPNFKKLCERAKDYIDTTLANKFEDSELTYQVVNVNKKRYNVGVLVYKNLKNPDNFVYENFCVYTTKISGDDSIYVNACYSHRDPGEYNLESKIEKGKLKQSLKSLLASHKF